MSEISHPEFNVHYLNSRGIEKAQLIVESFNSLVNKLQIICVDGEYFESMKKKLEEACFYAKKSMAINVKNQEQE